MENIEAMLCAYIEGDLDAAGRAQIEKHIQENPRHQKLIQELMTTRDLVRGLPRVKAPLDVGESVRGRVERSILLDDSPGAARTAARGNWWPQLFAVAAVLLLCASLCLILFKALAPTLKPAVFTENVAPKAPATPAIEPPVTREPSTPHELEGLAAAAANSAHQTITQARPMLRQQLAVQGIVPTVKSATFDDMKSIRQWLASSGYDVGNNAGGPAAMLMVVNSSDPPATNVQVQQFLRDSNVSWRLAPSGQTPSGQTPLGQTPPDQTPSGRATAAATTLPSPSTNSQSLPSATPTTQPSSDGYVAGDLYVASDVYVASGMTSKLADALRQSLAGNKDAVIHVSIEPSMEPTMAISTTQPAPTVIAERPENLNYSSPPAATQPSEVANANGDLAAASTQPSNAQSEKASPPNGSAAFGLSDISGARNVQPMDAVIVIRAAPAPAAAAILAPSTRPSSAAPSTQP